jgi:hypothetical protein
MLHEDCKRIDIAVVGLLWTTLRALLAISFQGGDVDLSARPCIEEQARLPSVHPCRRTAERLQEMGRTMRTVLMLSSGLLVLELSHVKLPR